MDVRATSQVGSLLEKDGVWAEDLTDIDRDFLVGVSSGGGQRVCVRTSFCAEKTEFMIGMYEVARSGDTERMSRRGSGRTEGSRSAAPADLVAFVVGGMDRRLTSVERSAEGVEWAEGGTDSRGPW